MGKKPRYVLCAIECPAFDHCDFNILQLHCRLNRKLQELSKYSWGCCSHDDFDLGFLGLCCEVTIPETEPTRQGHDASTGGASSTQATAQAEDDDPRYLHGLNTSYTSVYRHVARQVFGQLDDAAFSVFWQSLPAGKPDNAKTSNDGIHSCQLSALALIPELEVLRLKLDSLVPKLRLLCCMVVP